MVLADDLTCEGTHLKAGFFSASKPTLDIGQRESGRFFAFDFYVFRLPGPVLVEEGSAFASNLLAEIEHYRRKSCQPQHLGAVTDKPSGNPMLEAHPNFVPSHVQSGEVHREGSVQLGVALLVYTFSC